jgi:hypothetical protein
MTNDSSSNPNSGETLVYFDIEIGDQDFKTTSWDLYVYLPILRNDHACVTS